MNHSPERFASSSAQKLPTGMELALLVVITGVLFILQLRHFSPFMTDDAFISLRYSQRLLEGHGLTWNDMRPVEGYTNLLWVLLCAALGGVGMPLPLAAHVIGIVTTLLIVVGAVFFIYRTFPTELRFFAALLTCAALVLSSPFSMWALGGLEQPLLACLLVWAAVLLLPWLEDAEAKTSTAMLIGLLLGLAVVARADAALFMAAFYAAAVIADGISVRSVIRRARILPVPILFFAGQLAFRRAYYHEWLPNTAFVKVAFTLHRLRSGARYVYDAAKMNAVLLVLVTLASYALWRAGRRKPVLFFWTVGALWTVYLFVIGGDIFPAVRHFEPLIALSAFVLPGLALFAVSAEQRWKPAVVAGLLAGTALVATSDAMTSLEHWELQGASLGRFLHEAFGNKRPLLSSDAAGVVPFYSHLPALDPLGLNDYHIAHEASRTRGYGWVGHELGDGRYILDQKPDLLLFSSFDGSASLFPADQQIVDDPRFAKDYQPVRFDTPEPDSLRALLYVRRVDGKLGFERNGEDLVLPPYLAQVDLSNSARLVDGKAALVIAPQHAAKFERVPMEQSTLPGTWRVVAEGDGLLTLSSGDGAERVPGCEMCLRVHAPTFDFTLTDGTAGPVTLRSLRLVPEPASGHPR